MHFKTNLLFNKFHLLLEQSSIVTMLAITVVFFLILLILGVRKSYKLKKENEKLNELSTKFEEDKDKPYTDFTEGHLYDNSSNTKHDE